MYFGYVLKYISFIKNSFIYNVCIRIYETFISKLIYRSFEAYYNTELQLITILSIVIT